MATTKRHKGFLRDLSSLVSEKLQQRNLRKTFRLKRKLKLQKTNTDGWSVTLGTFPEYDCRAEIWLDRFTAHPDRKIYYCIYSHGKSSLAKLVNTVSSEFGKHLSIYLQDWDDYSDYYCLAKKLSKAWFGRPIYERYPSHNDFFYGIYEYDKTGLQKNVQARLAERANNFFQTIIDSVSDKQLVSDPETPYPNENRQTVMLHLRRERNRHAAAMCKHRDNYICQICKFDFSKYYGPIGNDFAEAHHIVPLGSNNKRRTTTIDDLITVCANCHRMLHRMDGRAMDISRLKKIIMSPRR